MKKHFYLLNLLFASLLMFSACSDDDDPKGFDSKLLVDKNWKITGYTFNDANEYAEWDACSQDDIWIFRENKEFEWNEGASKCDPSDNQVVYSGDWDLKENRLAIDGDDSAVIEELTSSTLRVKIEDDGDVEVFTLKAQ